MLDVYKRYTLILQKSRALVIAQILQMGQASLCSRLMRACAGTCGGHGQVCGKRLKIDMAACMCMMARKYMERTR
jgi:hypothetical protein